ncbi:hypothetical protein BU17DRAFT_102441 [Hysterangium stoloniferum]|nr:hypothetical protein BU17DRAFT_102441 [Hysterangium stoloniferum]
MMISNINHNLPLDKAELIAFFLESLLYGVSLLLFVITIWVLVYHQKSQHLNKCLVATSSLMMFFGTFHLAVDFVRVLEGFISQREAVGGAVAYFARLYEWTQLLKTAIFAIQTVLADSFANRSWAVIIPALCVIGTLIAGIGVVHSCAITKNGNVFASTLSGWITSFFTLTLAMNIICTSLIVGHIWFTTCKVARFSGQQTLMPVVIIVVESGFIYSASCITLLVVYLIGSNAQYPTLDGTFPIISIVFNLIIICIALGIAHGGASGMQTTNPPSAVGDNAHSFASHHNNSQFPMKPLAITVTQLVTKETHTPVKERDEDSFTTDEGRERKERGSWNAILFY